MILCVALIFASTLGVRASGIERGDKVTVSAAYFYDAEHGLLTLSVNCDGAPVSAIGVAVVYDAEVLTYTGYGRGRDLISFELAASLDNSGTVRVLAYSPREQDTGEIIRLYFKVEDESSLDGLRVELLPLTSKPAAVVSAGEVTEMQATFLPTSISLLGKLASMDFCGITPSGEVLLLTDGQIEDCLFDVTVVKLSGEIRRFDTIAFSRRVGEHNGKSALFSLDVGKIDEGYVAVIVDAYSRCGDGGIGTFHAVYLFCDGEFLE